VVTWGEFATAAPGIAARGRELLYRTGHGEAPLVTVRGDDPPRVHPISVAVVNDGLYAFILRSPKRLDLDSFSGAMARGKTVRRARGAQSSSAVQ